MRSRFVFLSVLMALVLVLAAGTASARIHFKHGRGIEGSGDMETREMDLETFTKIDVGGAFDLEITFGDRQKVLVTIDDNLWDNLEAEVSRSTFELGWDKSCQPDKDCKVEIVLKRLEGVEIHGAADVDIADFDGESFTFDVHGAADLTIDGRVKDLEINISGAGDADARELKAQNVAVSISGAGNAEVTVEKTLRGRVSGVGSLEYWGDPEEKDTSVSGIGSIKHKK